MPTVTPGKTFNAIDRRSTTPNRTRRNFQRLNLSNTAQATADGITIVNTNGVLSTGSDIPQVLYSGYNSTAITNTTAETAFSTFFTAQGGSLNVVGRKLRWVLYFTVTATNAYNDEITIKLKYDGSPLCTFSGLMVGGESSIPIRIEASTIVTAIGSSGSVQGAGLAFINGLDSVQVSPTTVMTGINLTVDAPLEVTATWSVASTNDSITLDDISIEKIA
jgi:hypothetical protein